MSRRLPGLPLVDRLADVPVLGRLTDVPVLERLRAVRADGGGAGGLRPGRARGAGRPRPRAARCAAQPTRAHGGPAARRPPRRPGGADHGRRGPARPARRGWRRRPPLVLHGGVGAGRPAPGPAGLGRGRVRGAVRRRRSWPRCCRRCAGAAGPPRRRRSGRQRDHPGRRMGISGDPASPTHARLTAPDPERERRQRAAIRQRVIADITERANGRGPAELVRELQEALARRGMAAEPRTWLRSVAADAAVGHLYVISEEAVRDAGPGDAPRRGPVR